MRLSQRKLNCALSVDFLWKKRLQIGQTRVNERSFRVPVQTRFMKSQINPFRSRGTAQTFPATAG